MRIRTIKPEFFTHEAIFEAELETKLPLRVAFAGLWCAADRAGRFKWEPRRLGVQILPYDLIDFSRVLDALATRGFILKYASENRHYGYIPSFDRHQVINNRERDSELPNPDECELCDASTTREARVRHASKAEGKGREGNKEGNGKDLLPLLALESEGQEKPNPEKTRVGKLLGRKETTKWNPDELKAYKAITPIDEDDLKLMEHFYGAVIEKDDYRRTAMLTLLRHWTGELDKARAFKNTKR